MERRILEVARGHLSSHGAAALSLRAVARDVGVAPSALYRYVSDRDELLTLLVVDAYSHLSTSVLDRIPEDEVPEQQVRALATQMRMWALAHPAQWGLIYGTPVPGYRAPASQTSIPGTVLMKRAVQIVGDAVGDGQGVAEDPSLAGFLSHARTALENDASDRTLAAAIHVWTLIIGAISAEVFGQFGLVSRDEGAAILDNAVSRALAGAVAES